MLSNPCTAGHRQIQSLIVRCPSKQDGCTWQGELRYQHEHTDGKCDYRPVKCPQECGMTMQWITLDHHMKEECINRPIQCLDCGEEGPCGYITTDHREECLYNLQKCPAPDCDVEICSSLLTFHMETDCEYSLVECKYRDAGCTAILPRSHMEEHENNDRYHLKVLTDSHHSLRKKYEQLLTTCDELKESVTSLISKSVKTSLPFITFKIKEYSAMEPITFYATPETYIFQVALKHTLGYLHMGIKVINGNNDHNLEWPFSGMVEVQLLNPLKDKDHFTGHIDMTPDPLRYSYANFHIPPKYVYNGHIYIRLTVISDLCKHWLK